MAGVGEASRVRARVRARLPDDDRRAAELGGFIAVGLACTTAYALLYTLLRLDLSDLAANALALLLTMAANFEANRRFTFRAGHRSRVHQVAGYLAAYAVGLAASTVALAGLLDLLDHPRGLENTAAALAAGVLATAVRFVLMRRWVFRPDPARPGCQTSGV
ncbi:MAG TPA: GtrA family protein [Solirubrobacteraceae bacterium]|jgi:putative flippase GtrA|nr:GtrA family protein [Solirubrobacteraceae bacterium]